MYALRLEQLFIKAYEQDPEDSPELQHKFLSTIPPPVANRINRDVALIRTFSKGRKITWREIVSLIEVEGDLETTSTEKSPVWKETRQPSKSNAAVVQHSKAATSKPPSRQRQSSSPSPRRYPQKCNYCGTPGHAWKDCWFRLGLCLACGSDRHQVGECALRRSPSSRRRHYSQQRQPRSRQPNRNPPPSRSPGRRQSSQRQQMQSSSSSESYDSVPQNQRLSRKQRKSKKKASQKRGQASRSSSSNRNHQSHHSGN